MVDPVITHAFRSELKREGNKVILEMAYIDELTAEVFHQSLLDNFVTRGWYSIVVGDQQSFIRDCQNPPEVKR